ncbi:MAG: hypothetical protein ACTHNK_05440, partial [Thermomicrobiales bacterium]
PSLFLGQSGLALPGTGNRFVRHNCSIGGGPNADMSQTDGLHPTNHPIGWSAIRLIRAIGHLEEHTNAEAEHGTRN